MESKRYTVAALNGFGIEVFRRLGIAQETCVLAVRSLLDASLMGIDTHGFEALDMYVDHINKGGLKAHSEQAVKVSGNGYLELWDMKHGFGLANARKLMKMAISKAKESGIFYLSCRNTNHIGACGVYGKMAADEGLVAMVSQQSRASLAPWGGRKPRMGTSPFAFVAPVKDSFPFYFDAQMGSVTGGKMKEYIRQGLQLPEGMALDAQGNPTTDPNKAWTGQTLPIGGHKGAGLSMVFEILSCVMSGNRFSDEIPSIVSNPQMSAGSSIFMLVMNPQVIMPFEDFASGMKKYVEYIESSPALDNNNPTRYPGRREGEMWKDRTKNGIPISIDSLTRFEKIAKLLEIEPLK